MIQSNRDFTVGGGIEALHRFSHPAMATVYEIIVVHEDGNYARQAANEAFHELDRLEQELSRFIENSDIARINSQSANQPTRIGLATFECLQQSLQIFQETGGAFDITVGPLLKCWLNEDKTVRTPSDQELELASGHVGLHHLQLNEDRHTVTVDVGPMLIDLGGIGKGYALTQLAQLLQEWELATVFLQGGDSSALALGAPPGMPGWPITLSSPSNRAQVLSRFYLRDRALSGSGLQKGQHIIDPRSGRPVSSATAAWACSADAAGSDALSTAFMIMNHDEIAAYCAGNPDVLALVVSQGDRSGSGQEVVSRFGPWDKVG